jgi:alkane 1-monooxygenase
MSSLAIHPAARACWAHRTLCLLSLHLLALALPLTTLTFLITGPHPWFAVIPWVLVVPALVLLERYSPSAPEERADVSRWPFDALLYAASALHLLNFALFGRLISVGGFWSADMLAAAALLGVSSAHSAVIVAHELIHRPDRLGRAVGRLLLATAVYEHFYTEHLRGHHRRVGTGDDPATARFGETFRTFFRRSVPGQFRSAWQIELRRLGLDGAPVRVRLLRSAVLHGVVIESALCLLLLAFFGPGAAVAFVLQALVAMQLIESVNYFEHWGLVREGRKIASVDSWDSEAGLSFYVLFGLSRHADHHAYAARPYFQLERHESSPKLPKGYFGLILMTQFQNRRLIQMLSEELQRKRLGPFADPASRRCP